MFRGMINELDSFFDEVPRSSSNAVEVGAFTLFVSNTPFDYYARPSLSYPKPIVKSDLVALEAACAHHQVGMSIEWVHETHPELAGLTAAYGLETRSHSLMVAAAGDVILSEIDDVILRVIGPDDPAFAFGRAVADVSFGFGGTNIGQSGPLERDAAVAGLKPELIEHLRELARSGSTVTAIAESDEGVVAVGSYQVVGDLAEIVAVATLPTARRRGLAGAVTALLTTHALGHGVRRLLLSAQDENVARVYERIGFHHVGSTGAAEKASS